MLKCHLLCRLLQNHGAANDHADDDYWISENEFEDDDGENDDTGLNFTSKKSPQRNDGDKVSGCRLCGSAMR